MALSSQIITNNASNNYNNINNSNNPSKSTKRSCLFDSSSITKRSKISRISDLLSSKNFTCHLSSDENDSGDEQLCYNADQIKAKRRASNRVSFCLNTELSRAVSKYSDDDEEEEDSSASPKKSKYLKLRVKKESIILSPNTTSDSSLKDRRVLPESDHSARSRCFEYLITAIDEAWARYCDATSYAEDEVYGYHSMEQLPNTPASIVTDDEDYKSDILNTTDITDYEDTDFEVSSNKSRVSQEPSSVKLQQLKDRLIKAKYYLQDFVDSEDPDECSAFWTRWDLIKYSTIDLVEDEDEEDIVESTIEELEDGRFFGIN